MWKLLGASGIVPRGFVASDDDACPISCGVGFTDLVRHSENRVEMRRMRRLSGGEVLTGIAGTCKRPSCHPPFALGVVLTLGLTPRRGNHGNAARLPLFGQGHQLNDTCTGFLRNQTMGCPFPDVRNSPSTWTVAVRRSYGSQVTGPAGRASLEFPNDYLNLSRKTRAAWWYCPRHLADSRTDKAAKHCLLRPSRGRNYSKSRRMGIWGHVQL